MKRQPLSDRDPQKHAGLERSGPGRAHPDHPPRLALRLLSRLCPFHLQEGIEGDLLELFQDRVATRGIRYARLRYWLDVLRVVRPHATSSLTHTTSTSEMLFNYIAITLRNLKRKAGFSSINIFGLGIGLACYVLILLFVRHELSFDRFHANADRIVRVSMTWIFDQTQLPVARTTTAPGPELNDALPQVENYVRFKRVSEAIFHVEDRTFKESGLVYADSTLLSVFSFPLAQGQANQVLKRPGTVVLTESTARRMFGEASPIGKTLLLDGTQPYEVTAVLEDLPPNSHIRFDLAASFSSLPEAGSRDFNSSAYDTYLLLSENTTAAAVQEATDALLVERFGDSPNLPLLHITPLTEVYLHGDNGDEWTRQGDMRYVMIFTAIAALILLIACINYMNLSTARAVDRAKEVGLRKTMGAGQGQLFGQFMGEALFTTGLGIVLAMGIVWMVLPWFRTFSGASINPDPNFLLMLLAATWLGVSILAGCYPSLVLSGFHPARVLKGRFQAGASGIRLRKGLVVFQFAITTFLIAGTIMIYRQLSFIQAQELGYDREHVVILPVDRVLRGQVDALKEELSGLGFVVQASAMSHVPVSGVSGRTFNATSDPEARQLMNAMEVDAQFVQTMGLEMVSGRNFVDSDILVAPDPESGIAPPFGIILNEAGAAHFGWTAEEAIGRSITTSSYSNSQGTVVGVVRNFNFDSLHHTIEPLVILAGRSVYHMLVRMAPGNVEQNLAGLQTVWEKLASHRPFEYQFLDQRFASVYESETRIGRMFAGFSILAILVASLGLLGLAAYAAVSRTREIGIRKALGASPGNIVLLLSSEFVKLVAIAFIMAAPLAWLAMDKWLSDFAFRTEIAWWIFAAAGLFSLVLALLTVSFQSVRAAMADPVKSLRAD